MSGAPSGAPLPFGAEAASYEAGRPEYPQALYAALFAHLSLTSGMQGFEIGAGTGLASRALLRQGVRLTAIEPDPRMAARLVARSPELVLVPERAETAQLSEAGFDFGISAMAMHWVDPKVVLRKARAWLKPGAGFAMWWTVFGDPARPDTFQQASGPLFEASGQGARMPHALQTGARLQELTAAGFEGARVQRFDWQICQSRAQVLDLTRSFSPVLQMEPQVRETFLQALGDLVDREFGGAVTRDFVSLLYTARAPLSL